MSHDKAHHADHENGGADAINVTGLTGAGGGGSSGGTPALVLSTTNAAGVASTFIREDDQLALFDATAPTTQAFGDSAATGSAAIAARRDHKHAMPAAPSAERAASSTTPVAVGTAAVGTGTTDARDDHVHATGAGTPSTQAFSDAAATGTGPAASMTDHKHAMPANPTPSFAAPTVALGSSAAAGAAGTVIRSDSTIAAFDATSPTTQAFGDSAAVGSAAFATRRDHKHAMPAAPTTIANDTLWAAKGDIVAATANDTAAVLAAGTQGQQLAIDSSASSGLVWSNPTSWGAMAPPTGITIGTMDRRLISGVAGVLTSGTMKLATISLPKNFTVTSISFLSGTTALVLGTSPHAWVALFDVPTLALLRQSTDDTAATWGASSLFTKNLSSTYTTTAAGLFYIGVMVAMTGGTMPTMATFSTEIAAVNALAPATGGNSTASLGATAPDPCAGPTGATVSFYGGVA